MQVIKAKAAAVANGDMSGVEETLATEIVTYDFVANDLLMRGRAAMSQSPASAESYLRLALKFQSQVHATAETLAEIKNPRPVFAKNFNAVAGNQQVNNAAGPQQMNNGLAPVTTRAEETASSPDKLLEAK